MVRLDILDASTVSVGTATVTGPVSLDAGSVTVGGTTFSTGTILVQSGTAAQTMELHPYEQAVLPPACVIVFILGLLWSRCT